MTDRIIIDPVFVMANPAFVAYAIPSKMFWNGWSAESALGTSTHISPYRFCQLQF
jgi:hypothetical protein